MMWKPIILLPYAATVVTLAIIPKAQAAVMIPTPTVSETAPTANKQDFISGGISAVWINDVVVETTPDQESTVYKVCFEYGRYVDIFTTRQPSTLPICSNVASPNGPFNDTTPQIPEFLGNQNFAALAAGGPKPNSTMPTSDGLLTALTNALGGDPTNGVIRFQGNTIFGGSNVGPSDLLQAYIPYEEVDANTVAAIKLVYNDLNEAWNVDGINTTITLPREGDPFNLTSYAMFARFEETGTVDLDPDPPQPSVPEPSGLMGIFLAGISMLATVRRR